MTNKYENIIKCTKEEGGILDTMLLAQKMDGYLTEEAMAAISEGYKMPASIVYETASFYSMIRLEPKEAIQIEICRGAPCHVLGAQELILEMEKLLGLKIGEKSKDGRYSFKYVECLGQCGEAPVVSVNEQLHTKVTIESITKVLKKEGLKL